MTIFLGSFTLQHCIYQSHKKVVRIFTGPKNKCSCHGLFIKLNILTSKTQYTINSDIHGSSSNFHQVGIEF